MDASGNLYGTTSYGGMGGTAFELSPPPQPGGTWTETVIYTFGAGGNEDGIVPLAGMVFDAEGNLYGTTSTGGSAGGGTVFELSPPTSTGGPWTEAILYNFNFDEDQRGTDPQAPVTFDAAGNLYGTALGGSTGAGVVFQLAPPSAQGEAWTETVLHNFGIGKDGFGVQGAGLTLTSSGAFLGTVPFGGTGNGGNGAGIAFALAPPIIPGGAWRYEIVYSFGISTNDGLFPRSTLTLQNGRVAFGTTGFGGSSGAGTVFQLSPPSSPGGAWTETTLYSFSGGNDGGQPLTDVILRNHTLYGTTSKGGNDRRCDQTGCGTVFQLSH